MTLRVFLSAKGGNRKMVEEYGFAQGCAPLCYSACRTMMSFPAIFMFSPAVLQTS